MTTYFTWNTGAAGYVMKYDTVSKQISQVTTPELMTYTETLAYDTVNRVVYMSGLSGGGQSTLYALTLGTSQSSIVHTFNTAITATEVYGGLLYISGEFTDIDNQPFYKNVTMDLVTHNVYSWDIGVNMEFLQIKFFPSGKTIASTGGTLASNTIETNVPTISKNVVSMYPNPTTDHITFSGLPVNTTLNILNLLGQQVAQIKIDDSTTDFNTVSLAPGVYLAHSENGFTGQFIKK